MKSYKDFLTERAPASPRGRARALKSAGQNDKNRAAKFGPAEKGKSLVQQKQEKGGALVHQPGKGTVGKEAVGTTANPRDTPKRPPGVSGTKQTATARMGQGGKLARSKAAATKSKAAEDRSEQAAKQKAAQDKFDKRNSGFMSGVKSALGGDSFRRKDPNDKEYNKIVDKKRGEAQKEAGKNFVKGAAGMVKNAAGKMVPKTGGQLNVSHGTPIV